jgi:hypothetical protein
VHCGNGFDEYRSRSNGNVDLARRYAADLDRRYS